MSLLLLLKGAVAAAPDYVDLASAGTITIGGDAGLTSSEYVDLASVGTIRLGGEAGLSVPALHVDLASAGTIRLGGGAALTTDAALAATTWQWTTPSADPDVLETLRLRLATRDGEYTVVDPSELSDLEIVLTDRGGFDSCSFTLRRDARLQLGDIDPLTAVDVEYLGRSLFEGRVEDAGQTLSSSSMERPITAAGPIAELKDHRAFRACYIDSRLSQWVTDQGGSGDSGIDVSCDDDEGLKFAARLNYQYQNWDTGRAYYNLLDGLAGDDVISGYSYRVRLMESVADVDDWSMHGHLRRSLNGANVWGEICDTYTADGVWHVTRKTLDDPGGDRIRTLVLQLSMVSGSSHMWAGSKNAADQIGSRTDAPIAYKFSDIRVVGRDLGGIDGDDYGHYVYATDVMADIVAPFWSGETEVFMPDSSSLALTQCVFDSIPKDRSEALEEINAMLSWDYAMTRKTFTLRAPYTASTVPDQDLYTISLTDPGLTYSLTPAFSECRNAVRVAYTSKAGKAREEIVHADSDTLGDLVRSEVYTAPDSIRTKAAAQSVGERWLESHAEPPISGTLTQVGTVPVASGEDRDCLLMQPGEFVKLHDAPAPFNRGLKITRVTLRPLEHAADVEMGVNSTRFDRWLARLSYGARTRKR